MRRSPEGSGQRASEAEQALAAAKARHGIPDHDGADPRGGRVDSGIGHSVPQRRVQRGCPGTGSSSSYSGVEVGPLALSADEQQQQQEQPEQGKPRSGGDPGDGVREFVQNSASWSFERYTVFRLDPSDGTHVTREKLTAEYPTYNERELNEYWEQVCLLKHSRGGRRRH